MALQMQPPAIILFAHGARDPAWAAPFQTLRGLLAARLPESRVELAFLELMTPDLVSVVDDMLAHGIGSIEIIPMFMAKGGHLQRDLPNIVQDIMQRHPAVTIRIAPPIGEAPEVLAAMAEWVAARVAGVG